MNWRRLLLAFILALAALQIQAQPAWKPDRNDFALSGQFKTDLGQDYTSMKAVLVELGLAK